MSAVVIVLGAGVIGSSIAFHLARAGLAVALIDPAEPGTAPSASWASAGGLRSQGRHAADRPLSIRAALRWQSLAVELGADLEVRFGGHLHLAENEQEAETVRQRVEEDSAGGVAIELVDAADIRRLAPGLVRRAVLAAFTAGDGQAHPGRTAAAFVRAGRRLGVDVRRAGATLALEQGRIEGVRLSDGTKIHSELTVLAAGAWSIALLEKIGLRLPLRWRGLQMLLSEISSAKLAPTVTAVGRNLSLKQSPSGQFMIGGRWFGAMADDKVGTQPIDAHVARQWDAAASILPAIAKLRIAQSWAGAEAQSIDQLPYIGRAALPGLYLAAGFSNHGFQISPVVGELVANDIARNGESLLKPFDPARAAWVDAERIQAFVREPIAV